MQRTLDSVVLDFSIDERVTYQYALRFALLLQEEDRNAPPRMRLTAYFNGHPSVYSPNESFTPKSADFQSTFSAADGNNDRAVRGRQNYLPATTRNGMAEAAYALPTPTLSADWEANGGLFAPSSEFSEQFHLKNWRNSLAEMGESATKILKNGENKKINLAMIWRQRSASTSPSFPSNFGSTLLESQDDGVARLTPELLKSIIKCLGRETNKESVHPFTKSCYSQLTNALKVKAFSRYLGGEGNIDDILKMFAQFALIKCKCEQIIGKEDISRLILSQVDKLVDVLRIMLSAKGQSNKPAWRALIRLDHYQSINLPGVIPHEERSPSIRKNSSDIQSNSWSASHPGSTKPLPSQQQRQQQPLTVLSRHRTVSDWLQHVFKVQTTQHHYITQQLKQEVTENNALDDLKKWLQLVKMNRSFASRSEDFISEPAYKRWRNREETSLDQLIVSFVLKKTYNYSPFENPNPHQVRYMYYYLDNQY